MIETRIEQAAQEDADRRSYTPANSFLGEDLHVEEKKRRMALYRAAYNARLGRVVAS